MAKQGKKKRDQQTLAASVFTEYCSSTSIHGIGYLGASDKTLLEKAWWLSVFVLSVIACGSLIARAWLKWQQSPVIVAFAQEQTPVWDVPFPAITVCPINKVQQTSKYNYTELYQHRDQLQLEQEKKFWDISLVCNLKFLNGEQHGAKLTGKDAIGYITEVAPQLTDTIPSIVWKNKKYNDLVKTKYFAPRLTEEGLCFSFNSLAQEDLYTEQLDGKTKYIDSKRRSEGWTIEDGYPIQNQLDTYPERTLQDGLSSGISIELRSRSYERDFACGDPSSGYKILVHNPAEEAKTSQRYIVAPANKQLVVSVEPQVVTTSRNLLDIAVTTRNCFFASERRLQFFRMYTQNNCQTECFANVTSHHCQCVPFYLPRDSQTKICGFKSLDCIKEAEGMILEYSMLTSRQEISPTIANQLEYKIFKSCNCLPGCATLDYTVDSFQADYYFQEAAKASNFTNDIPLEKLQVTKVDIFFKETYFLALSRSELYGRTDFLANCGGLLGLFMGFSFLSLLEIFYFLIIRTWCRARRNRAEDNAQRRRDSGDVHS